MHSVRTIYRFNSKNNYSLYIQITKDRSSRMVALGISLLPSEWDGEKDRVRECNPNSEIFNSYISQKLAEAMDIATANPAADVSIIAHELRKILSQRSTPTFTEYFLRYRDWLLSHGKIGSYIKVKSSISKLDRFTGGRRLDFADIDVRFLKRYEEFLKVGLGNRTNTIHGTMKVMRKVFNDAVREGLINFEQNPFMRYGLRTEKTNRIFLTSEEVTKIDALNINANSRMALHKDMFIFSCFACGLRVSDLLLLKWGNFDGSHLSIIVQKTKDQISIPLPNRALEILEYYRRPRYRGKDFIFPALRPRERTPLQLNSAISSATAYLNKDLRKIGEMAGIEKHISMGTSRHTWATLALRKGMRIEHVSKLLGHATIKTTQLYAKIVDIDLDRAMEVFNV